MKVDAYLEKLSEYDELDWPEWEQKVAILQAEYLAEQAIPDAATAAETIARKLPNLPHSHPLPEECELLELGEEDLPNKRWWRCRCGDAIIDASAETGELYMVSTFRILLNTNLS